jgi:hypothetical protein
VLARLAGVTRDGGLLRVSLKEGDGEGWSTHGSVRQPRHFTYWRGPDVARVLAAAGGSEVEVVGGIAGPRTESWLEVSAVRDGVSP